MSDVVFALRRNASTDPPDHADTFITDDGARYYEPGLGWQRSDFMVGNQPAVWWLDVRPSDEPLTTDDLNRVIDLAVTNPLLGCLDAEYTEPERASLDRLRAALDALDG